MRKVFSVIFALIVLLSMAMGVQALESKSIQRDNGATAYASWSETNGDLTTYTDLSVTKSNDGTDIYLGIYTWDSKKGETVNDKFGYTFTTDDVFSIDKQLNSASLSDVKIDVYNWNNDKTETLTVNADWIGNGEVSKGSSRFSSRNGDYTYRSSDSSTSRDATATGSINDNNLGKSNYANLYKFKSAYINMEK
jgi:hypothetical protein